MSHIRIVPSQVVLKVSLFFETIWLLELYIRRSHALKVLERLLKST